MLVLAALLLMGMLPQISVFGHPLRKVDILSDLHPKNVENVDSLEVEEVLLPPPPKPAFVDTCRL